MGQVAIIYRCKIVLFPSHEEHSHASYKVDGQKKTDIHLKLSPVKLKPTFSSLPWAQLPESWPCIIYEL